MSDDGAAAILDNVGGCASQIDLILAGSEEAGAPLEIYIQEFHG